MSINENKIKMSKDYIMIELNEDMELDLEHVSNLEDIGIQNGILHIDHGVYNVRFESVYREPCGEEPREITSIEIEHRNSDLSAEEILDKIRGTEAPLIEHDEDMSLVAQLKSSKAARFAERVPQAQELKMRDFLSKNKDF